jgi:hypothetical protein
MKKLVLSILTGFTKKRLLLSLLVCTCVLAVYPQAVYVDSENGDDSNPGTEAAPFYSIHKAAEIIESNSNSIYTVKINPGIYVLDSFASISTQKDMTGRRIVFEANILPDDASWDPLKMPVVVNRSQEGKIPGFSDMVGFLIDESHVTIRGIKFLGHFYPNTYYYPITRINKEKVDLLVEQCMFVGDENASRIQVGVLTHGDTVRVNHCVFYNCDNGVVFWLAGVAGTKTGNSFTNSIVIGGFHAIWTSDADTGFSFKRNIISDCEYAWIKNHYNTTVYTLDTCVIVNNQHYQGVWRPGGIVPEAFPIIENDVIKTGEISLRLIDNLNDPIPIDYLHILPDSLGYDLNAGLFKGDTSAIRETIINTGEFKILQNSPNPFKSATTIKYNLPNADYVTLKIYNIVGQELVILVDEFQTAGEHEIEWKPREIASGIYFYKLEAGDFTASRKLILKK